MTSPRPPVLDHGAHSDATNTRLVKLSPHLGGGASLTISASNCHAGRQAGRQAVRQSGRQSGRQA
eukprot:2923246-Pyramimonas_sp.AAC.1